MKHIPSILPAFLLAPFMSTGAVPFAYAHGDAGLEGRTLEVVLSEWSLGFEAVEIDAGTLRIHVANEGKAQHDLTATQVGATAEMFRTRLLSPGEIDEVSFEFSKGQYILYCSVPGHAERGMLASLVVGGAAE